MPSLLEDALVGFLFVPNLTLIFMQSNKQVRNLLLINASIGVLGFVGTKYLIRSRMQNHLDKGMFGMDINKKEFRNKGSREGEKPIPEAMGIYSGALYLLCLTLACICGQLFYPKIDACSTLPQDQFEFSETKCLSQASTWDPLIRGAFVICSMLLVGYVDDTQDLKWRDKLFLSFFGSIPIVTIYTGGTTISLPKPARYLLNIDLISLGFVYYIFILLVAVFSTNAINILAGINGLETGQTVVLACGALAHNLIQLMGTQGQNTTTQMAHLQSALLLIPLALTTQALLNYNQYPSKVFVGDTFTYFAGMCLAVASIYGHYCETFLVFCIPQVINFVISMPQLMKIIPCPKHRLPRYDPQTNLLHYTENYNLVNAILYFGGPRKEQDLCNIILVLQYLCCIMGIVLHIILKGVYK